MNYSQSLTYLNSFYDLEKTMRLPAGRRWKLERMRHLLEIFGQPQKSFLPVVIVGTKGKGSTGFFLQSILKEAGIGAGFYSSPHLESPCERIRINGKIISRVLWAQILTKIKKRLGSKAGMTHRQQRCVHNSLCHRAKAGMTHPSGPVTYFEIMTLMAALAFKEAGVKAAVFEAGMGGRLDAVNALGAPLVIVTPIHLDHQDFLGSTIAEIAAEKAAVIHSGADVILAPQTKMAERVIRIRAKKQSACLWPVTKKSGDVPGLQGTHQEWNAAAAVLASEILLDILNVPRIKKALKQQRRSEMKLSDILMKIPEGAVKAGLAAKDWPGRFEVLQTRPKIILDGAHNPAAIAVLVKTLRQTHGAGPLKGPGPGGGVVIFGVTRDKDSRAMLKMLASFFLTIILVPLSSPRGKTTTELLQEAQPFFFTRVPAVNLEEAVRLGKSLVGATGTLVVTGSFYLVGAARSNLVHARSESE